MDILQLADVTPEDFWRAVNAARPGFIRVEADELTYDLHIMNAPPNHLLLKEYRNGRLKVSAHYRQFG